MQEDIQRRNKLGRWIRTISSPFVVVVIMVTAIISTINQFSFANATTYNYTQLFTDSFTRPDTTAPDLDNGWLQPLGSVWSITSNQLVPTSAGTGLPFYEYPLARPTSVKNGKARATFTVPATAGTSVVDAYPMIARYTDGSTAYYLAYFYTINNNTQATLRVCPATVGVENCNTGNGNYNINNPWSFISNATVNPSDFAAPITLEMEINSINATTTELTVAVLKDNGSILTSTGGSPLTLNGTDSTAGAQNAGMWGLNSFNSLSKYDNYTLYQTQAAPVDMALNTNVDIIEFGSPITLTVSDDVEQTVTFSDSGMGGTFNPATVDLSADNSFTAATVYTPVKAGEVVFTASAGQDGAETTVFVSPYSTSIGFIGDSITYGTGKGTMDAVQTTCYILGSDSTCLNVGVGDTDTQDWADDLFSGKGSPTGGHTRPWTWAQSVFNGNVDVVSIMLGANDAEIGAKNIITGEAYSVEEYEVNLQRMIDQYKAYGIRQVILNYNIFFGISAIRDASSQALNLAYQGAIDNLVATNDGYVLLGDTDAYDWFEATQAFIGGADTVHPNAAGHTKLGTFWATAIKANLVYQTNPDHEWQGGVNKYELESSNSITHITDKYIGEFANDIKVDGITLTSSEYTSASGSTAITLLPDYLETLSTGNHTLTVGFDGGVSVAAGFIITAKNTSGGGGDKTPEVPATGLFSNIANGSAMTIPFTATTIIIVSGIAVYFVINKRYRNF